MTDHAQLLDDLTKALDSQREGKLDSNDTAVLRNLRNVLNRSRVLARQGARPPLRTIHHLSCTGGTLIARCVAAMANVWLLNEINPHARENYARSFRPSDVIALLKQNARPASEELRTLIFLAEIGAIQDECYETGRALVLRDHSHGHFLMGDLDPKQPSLKEILQTSFNVLPLVTLRDPIDSYLSMCKQHWHKQFYPSTFSEYSRRYKVFLESYSKAPVVHYEEFTVNPDETMRTICRLLDLDFFEGFESIQHTFLFSGDSGRKGGKISARPKREGRRELLAEPGVKRDYETLLEAFSNMKRG